MVRRTSPSFRLACVGSLVLGVYVAVCDWILSPIHETGYAQGLLGYLNGLANVLSFPGLFIAIRNHIRLGHHTTKPAWFFILGFNMLVWGIGLFVLARVLGSSKPVASAKALDTDEPSSELPSPSRRGFLKTTLRTAAGGMCGLTAYSILVEPRWFQITHRVIPIRQLPPALDDLRIVQLTDLHHGPTLSIKYIRQVLDATNALQPDVVLLTGDYVHRSPIYTGPVVRELAKLRAKIGVVGVLGNHDWWEDGLLAQQEFRRNQIPLIDNTRLFITPQRTLATSAYEGLCIAGVGDYYEDRQHYGAALGNVPRDMPRLLLSHNPDVAEDDEFNASGLRVDLMLSGHTHGGQIWIPGLGTPILPSRYGQKYARGLVEGPCCRVFISRGIGTTVLPMRFTIRPEICVLQLKSA